MNKAVFLDRDGVINKKKDDYVKSVNEFVMLTDVAKAIKLLNDKNYLVIIVTNQSAINRGLLSHEELSKIHGIMKQELEKSGAHVDAIYYCPHRPDENCPCRKPKTDMLEKAIHEHSISKKLSCLIGDSESDIVAARQVGILGIKMKTNGNILEVVNKILEN